MLSHQRMKEIEGILAARGIVRVTEAAEEMGVREETIRRDLVKLTEMGKVERVHGGAVLRSHADRELPFGLRQTSMRKEKEAIAREAVREISEGETIGLDASSTVHELVRVLGDVKVTVVTNSMAAAADLVRREKVKVVVTGGELDRVSMSYVGVAAEEALARYRLDRVFVSCKGVDKARGMSEASEAHAQFKKKMIELGERKYLLVDRSKFGVRSAVFFGGVDAVDVVVSDEGLDTGVMEELRKSGVEVKLAQARK